MKLHGKIAIVTGAASGIGKASADIFRKAGATVVGVDVAEAEGVRRVDAASEADISELVARTVRDHGGLDIFLANAGISGSLDSLLDQTVEEWTDILRINVIGPFLAVKHGAPAIRRRGGGAIICTASTAGLRSGGGSAAYSASKAAVMNLVKTAATQLCGANIRVNAIAPGLTRTGMTKMVFDGYGAEEEPFIASLNPLKRSGLAEEIGRAALFLASDAASYVNGQTLVVDGGLSASHPFAQQQFGRTTL